MGASYFALLPAKALFDRARVAVRVEQTAYLTDYGQSSLKPGQPVLVVSQSGRSVEAIRLAHELPPQNPLIVITNDQASELAKRAHILLPLLAAPDLSVALKTYTSTVALLLLLASRAIGGDVLDLVAPLMDGNPMANALTRAERQVAGMLAFAGTPQYVPVLGRGPSVASALGAALLIKETAKLPADGADAAQFRHGAVEVIRPGMLVVLFAPPGKSHGLNERLAGELEAYGARVLLVGPGDHSGLSCSRFVVETETVDEYLAPIFEIVPMQLLSRAMALERGVEPGSFVNTVPVITTA